MKKANLVWPQQAIFKKLVLAYRRERGLSPEQFAELLRIQPSSLHNLLYDYKCRPSLDVVQTASGILGCPASDLMDDRGGEIGAGLVDSELSQAKRLVSKLIIQGIKDPEISDEQALSYLKAWQAMLETGKNGHGSR